jgi:hypothetical protein
MGLKGIELTGPEEWPILQAYGAQTTMVIGVEQLPTGSTGRRIMTRRGRIPAEHSTGSSQ